jgi:glycerate kinase
MSTMKKIILIPDSFKGTMSSLEVCAIMAERARAYFPLAEIISIPIADGGEGSVDAFLAAGGGERVFLTVKGPFMEDIQCYYGLINGGKTAVIETASCAGLPLAGKNPDPSKTTTFGVGEQIRDAVRRGCEKIIVGLGGSATNDFGAGAAAGAGARFFDQTGAEFIPTGGSLARIASIDMSGLDSSIKNTEITALCDIDNPLYGETGAAYVFGPQKGADPEMTRLLDHGLRAVAGAVKAQFGTDVAAVPGSGAAGGMGGGMIVFFNAALRRGIETVLDAVSFDARLSGADYVFTGEGRIEGQSLRGKAVIGVARRAKKQGIPVIVIAGDIGDNIEGVYGEGVKAVFSINRVSQGFEENRKRCKSDLRLTVDSLMRLMTG